MEARPRGAFVSRAGTLLQITRRIRDGSWIRPCLPAHDRTGAPTYREVSRLLPQKEGHQIQSQMAVRPRSRVGAARQLYRRIWLTGDLVRNMVEQSFVFRIDSAALRP